MGKLFFARKALQSSKCIKGSEKVSFSENFAYVLNE